jgi:hypothetical protein
MNYDIIKDSVKLKKFIKWLPDLEPEETFYCALFARKKYDNTLKSDKAQLKRFCATKDFLYKKIRQLQVEIGAYSIKGTLIKNGALALYIMPNPRSLRIASLKCLTDIAKVITTSNYTLSPHRIALTNIQKSPSRKIYFDFDFDNIQFYKENFRFLNYDCMTLLQTKQGFHVLVNVKKIKKEYKKDWYSNMTSLMGCDVKGDILMPIPGCTQGGFIPLFDSFGE